MQIRYLNHNVNMLYEKYVNECSDPVSRSLFYSLKPFWVRKADLSQRYSCLCKLCSNFQFMCNSAFFCQMIPVRDSYRLLQATLCSVKSSTCMLKQCSTCNSKQLIDVTNISDETVNYQCWMTETNNKGYKSTERKRVNSSVSNFILKFAISFWS